MQWSVPSYTGWAQCLLKEQVFELVPPLRCVALRAELYPLARKARRESDSVSKSWRLGVKPFPVSSPLPAGHLCLCGVYNVPCRIKDPVHSHMASWTYMKFNSSKQLKPGFQKCCLDIFYLLMRTVV